MGRHVFLTIACIHSQHIFEEWSVLIVIKDESAHLLFGLIIDNKK